MLTALLSLALACPPAVDLAEARALAAARPTVQAGAAAPALLGRPAPWTGDLRISATPLARYSPAVGLEGELELAHSFSLSGLGAARARTAEAERGLLAAQGDQARIEAELAAVDAWTARFAAEREAAAAAAAVTGAEALLDLAQRARAAGAVTSLELAEAEAFLADARLSRLDAEGRAADAGFALAGALGCEGAVGAALGAGEVGDFDPAQIGAAALRAREAALEVAEAQSRLALLAAAPELEVLARAEQDGPKAQRAGLGLSLRFPLFEKGTRARGQARVAASQARAAAEEARAERAVLAAALLHEIEHAAEVREVLVDESLPALRRLVSLGEAGLRLGDAQLPPLVRARARMVAAERALARAEASLVGARARAEIWSQGAN